MTETRVPIGVIGGSGLYKMDAFDVVDEVEVTTPFGPPSAPIVIGELSGRRVAFLPRHGRDHQFNPSTVPYQANIWALKKLGVFWVVGVNAVGSLKLEIEPGQFCIPDNVIDKTYKRANTLYERIAVHAGLSHPYHPTLRKVLLEACEAAEVTVHDGGTAVCMEGPAFSTVAESELHRSWGASLIGMTTMPESRLAREAEMCYASIALPTDYDVWNEDDHVDVAAVIAILRQNIANVQRVLLEVVPRIPLDAEDECDAKSALQFAIMTAPEAIDEWTKTNFTLTLAKYID